MKSSQMMLRKMAEEGQPQSPTQYYLSELGLNGEWQNNLLQFGLADQSGQEYLNKDLSTQQSFDRNAIKIRTFPHIIIPAAPERVLELPDINSGFEIPTLAKLDVGNESSNIEKINNVTEDITASKYHQDPTECLVHESFDMVIEALRGALPREEGPLLCSPEVVQRTIEILQAYPQLQKQISKLEATINQLKSIQCQNHQDNA